MARIRTIKPEFWTDSKTGSLSGDATKLFIGMLTFSDDYGVLEYDLAALKAKIFPYVSGSLSKIINKPLEEILSSRLAVVFKWDEKSYFWICNFQKHQKVDRPGKPLIKNFDSAKLLNLLNSTNPRESSLCSSSVVVVEGSVVEGKGEESGEPDITPQVVSHLNQVLETNYKADSKKTRELVQARVNQGFTFENFKTVIDKKAAQWKNDPKMCAYLRPETLFGTKFESYLNERAGPVATGKTTGNKELIDKMLANCEGGNDTG